MTNVEKVQAYIEAHRVRSAWMRGVHQYALELAQALDECGITGPLTEEQALNGARSWEEYSEGGCALIYDADIADRLCSPSELKKVRGGDRAPNAAETWLDVQARALQQAFFVLRRATAE